MSANYYSEETEQSSSEKTQPLPRNSAKRTEGIVQFSCLWFLTSEGKWCEC